jgi:hypothetical protein
MVGSITQTPRRHVIIEDSRRVTVELVLSLLWWKNELQLLELEAEEDA